MKRNVTSELTKKTRLTRRFTNKRSNMYQRSLSVLTVLATVCVLSIPGMAQQPTLAEQKPAPPAVVQATSPSQPPIDEVQQSPLSPIQETSKDGDESQLASFERRITAIEKQLHALLRDLEFAAMYETHEDPNTQVDLANHVELPGGSGRIGRIEKQLKSNSDSLEQALVAVQDEVSSVRQELSAAKEDIGRLESKPNSASATGRLVLQNWTGSEQFVLVNGAGYRVPPGRTILNVPYSILEAYVPRYEPAKLWGMSQWRRSGDTYEMQIDLRPR